MQPGQRVMFQHGSLHEVVDQEKEPCGCPPLPLKSRATSSRSRRAKAWLQSLPVPPGSTHGGKAGTAVQPLTYNAGDVAAAAGTPSDQSPSAESAPPPKPAHHKKNGLFERIGHFFRRIFGAE